MMKTCKRILVMLIGIMMLLNTVCITSYATSNDASLDGLYSNFIEPLPTRNPLAENSQSFYDQWATMGHKVPGLLNFFSAANKPIASDEDLKNGQNVGRLGSNFATVVLRDEEETSASVSVEDDKWAIKFTQDGSPKWYYYDSLAVLAGTNTTLNQGSPSNSKIGFQYDFKYENPNGYTSTNFPSDTLKGSTGANTYSTGYFGNLLAIQGYGGAEFYKDGNSTAAESFRPVIQATDKKYTMCYGARTSISSNVKETAFSKIFAGDQGLEYGKWYTMRVIFDCANTKMTINIFTEDGTLRYVREVVDAKYTSIQSGFRLASCPILDTYYRNVYVVREGMYVNAEPVITEDNGTVTATANVNWDCGNNSPFNQGFTVNNTTGWTVESPTLILALYSKEDGAMLNCKLASVDVMKPMGTATTLTATLDVPSEEYYAKAFVWRDVDNLYPLIESVNTQTAAK